MDGTDTSQKDTPQKTGQSSTGETQGTSKGARPYTEQEIDQIKQKAASDALAAKGRESKKQWEAEKQSLQEELERVKAQMAEWQRQREEAELEEARNDPNKLADYQAKVKRRQTEADLEKQRVELKKQQQELEKARLEHEEEVKLARETQREIRIWEIGEEYGVDPVVLKELGLDMEKTEQIAKQLAKSTKKTEDIAPDSGVTANKGLTSDEKKLKERYPTMF